MFANCDSGCYALNSLEDEHALKNNKSGSNTTNSPDVHSVDVDIRAFCSLFPVVWGVWGRHKGLYLADIKAVLLHIASASICVDCLKGGICSLLDIVKGDSIRRADA